MKTIQTILKKDKTRIRTQFNNYLTELSEFDPTITFVDGVLQYRWFDYYWIDDDRFPFELIIDGIRAGFAFVRKLSDTNHEIAEFYVEPNFRGGGNALWFASELVKKFGGTFEFSTRIENVRAIKFWDKFCKNYVITNRSENNDYVDWTIKIK